MRHMGLQKKHRTQRKLQLPDNEPQAPAIAHNPIPRESRLADLVAAATRCQAMLDSEGTRGVQTGTALMAG